jgi:hypothetical protein
MKLRLPGVAYAAHCLPKAHGKFGNRANPLRFGGRKPVAVGEQEFRVAQNSRQRVVDLVPKNLADILLQRPEPHGERRFRVFRPGNLRSMRLAARGAHSFARGTNSTWPAAIIRATSPCRSYAAIKITGATAANSASASANGAPLTIRSSRIITSGFSRLAREIDGLEDVAGSSSACAATTGNSTTNRAPNPCWLLNVTSPLCWWTIPYTIDSPSPVPTPGGLVVKNGSNMR